MKNLLKKCISAILTVVMLSAFAVPTFAAETATTGITTVADFSNYNYTGLDKTLGDATGSNNQISPSTVAYGDGNSSLAWKLQNNSEFQYTLDAPLTIRSTDTVKIRMRATQGTQKINIKINGTRVGAASVTEDWMEYSYSGATSLTSVGFQCGGWSQTAYTTGARIYIDSIWLEKADASYNKVDYPLNGADDAVYEIVSFNSPAKKVTTLADNWTESTSTTNTRENGNGMFKMLNIPAFAKDRTTTVATCNVSKGDCQYINMWVYSPRPQNTGVRFQLNGSNTYYVSGINFDWQGWKLLSYAIPSGITGNITNVQFVENSYKRYESGVTLGGISNANVSGYGAAAVTSDTTIGIESIWISKNQPVGANAVATPVAAESAQDLATDIVIADYNKQGAAIPEGTTEMAVSYKGGKSARSRRFGGEYLSGNATSGYEYKNAGITDCATEANFVIFDDSTNPYTNITSDGYLNFWVYNPSSKYDQRANYSEYVLVVNHNASGSFANKTFGIISNFEGWKLFSIPMSEISSSWTEETKINTIKITTNAWLPGKNTDVTKMSHAHTADELAASYRGSGTYNVWPDGYNYFNIEKMWISKEKPAEIFNNNTIAPAYTLSNSEINQTSLGLKKSSGNIGTILGEGAILKITSTGFKVIPSDTTFDSQYVTVTARDMLDVSSEYYVIYPEMYDSNGIKHIDRLIYKLTTKDNYIGGIVVDSNNPASASVIYRGQVPAERANSKLIGAVYTSDNTLRFINESAYSENNQTMTVTLTGVQNGDTVKYFLWDKETLKPFQLPVEKSIETAK